MVKYSDGLDGVAAALAHPGRRQVVDRLRAGPATSSELAELLGIGLPAVTHLLAGERLRAYAVWLGTRESFWHNQLDALSDHLEST